jgi:hypothetical protein
MCRLRIAEYAAAACVDWCAGLRTSVKEFASQVEGISSKDVLEIMLATQYFDMLDRVGSNDKSQLVLMNDAAMDPAGEQHTRPAAASGC